MLKNLQEFWSVQQASDVKPRIFTSLQSAKTQRNAWETAVLEKFNKWKNSDEGKPSDLIIDCSYELGERNVSLNAASLPSGIYYHPMGSETRERWENSPGVDKVRWGNPATARPSRKKKLVIA